MLLYCGFFYEGFLDDCAVSDGELRRLSWIRTLVKEIDNPQGLGVPGLVDTPIRAGKRTRLWSRFTASGRRKRRDLTDDCDAILLHRFNAAFKRRLLSGPPANDAFSQRKIARVEISTRPFFANERRPCFRPHAQRPIKWL